ncbi:MAG: type II/IV secretion system protein [Candidatus Levybacteria bacterium]|nr:type II/IV secretion system protein [Candidatus Levybacteria bacterium]
MLLTNDELKTILTQNKILDEKKFEDLIRFSRNTNATLVDALVEKEIITDDALGQLIASFLRLPFINLSKLSIPEDALTIIPENVARKQKVIIFAKDDNGIKLAMADPRNTEIQQMIAKKTEQNVFVYYSTERDIYNTLRIYRRDFQKTFDRLLKEESGILDAQTLEHAPVAKIVDLIIDYAYQDKSSDIHIEPQEKNSLIRFRIDGILHDIAYVPKALHDQIITRIKVLSRLRTDEHLAPQDGKMHMQLEEEDLDIRVSIIPVVEGEKTVLRLLASRFRQFSLLNLGMTEMDLHKMVRAYSKSYGMILSTGPTGSGKTTSIYAILKILNSREKNITTIEDPVEYRIKGVNQIHVNTKTDLTFASGLRSILRQDPNIVFVGEIRDSETAGIAVNAALTGHLVLSTLHTNDAATALPRLTDMKVEPFLVASTVNVIVAQRLIRKICDFCKTQYTIATVELEKNIPKEMLVKHFGNQEVTSVYKGAGCKSCHFTGYAQRIGIFEVLEVTKDIRKLIVAKNDSDVIAKAAALEGMTTMFDDGLQKVARGITTLEEVLRVTKVESL